MQTVTQGKEGRAGGDGAPLPQINAGGGGGGAGAWRRVISIPLLPPNTRQKGNKLRFQWQELSLEEELPHREDLFPWMISTHPLQPS